MGGTVALNPAHPHFFRPCRLVVRTRDFHSRNRSSILRRVIHVSLERNEMSDFFGKFGKVLYGAALASIAVSVYTYQSNENLGIFIGLWVPTLLLLGPTCPWANRG